MGRTVEYDHKGREVFNSSWPADMNEDSVEPLCFQKQCEELWDAIRAYRDAKGRFQTQKACEHLLTLLPENQPEPQTENNQ